ncbi:MAG: sigma-70 family RNA polymerase sigma factor [Verrucomicrobia bacterium]|nr:sigma-70 family RNA polymerase sigma factor [Verrucomicrobiota bacterium]
MNGNSHLVDALPDGPLKTSDELISLVYSDLRRIAADKMAFEASGHILQPTALVHEAWLRIVQTGRHTFRNRAHFLAVASEAMRRILIDDARRRSRFKRGDHPVRVELDEIALAPPARADVLLKLDEALQQLEAELPDKAEIVKLKYFGGLTNQELAEGLDVTERTVERAWAYAKAWLCRAIQNME